MDATELTVSQELNYSDFDSTSVKSICSALGIKNIFDEGEIFHPESDMGEFYDSIDAARLFLVTNSGVSGWINIFCSQGYNFLRKKRDDGTMRAAQGYLSLNTNYMITLDGVGGIVLSCEFEHYYDFDDITDEIDLAEAERIAEADNYEEQGPIFEYSLKPGMPTKRAFDAFKKAFEKTFPDDLPTAEYDWPPILLDTEWG